MDTEFPDNLRKTLTHVIESTKALPNVDRLHREERAEARNVQRALKALGYEASIGQAAAIWTLYSGRFHAGWLAGAETVRGASEGILRYCQKIEAAKK